MLMFVEVVRHGGEARAGLPARRAAAHPPQPGHPAKALVVAVNLVQSSLGLGVCGDRAEPRRTHNSHGAHGDQPASIDAPTFWKRVTPQRPEFDGAPRPFRSAAAPRPAKLSATPIAHAPGLTVPAAVAVQEVAAVGVAVCSTAAAGVAQ